MAVIKEISNSLIHTPDILFYYGSTPQAERNADPECDYLKALKDNLRNYPDSVSYLANQAYIGNVGLDELSNIPTPWYTQPVEKPSRFGKFGEIMPEEEFYGMLKIADTFDLVWLNPEFSAISKNALSQNRIFSEAILNRIGDGTPVEEISKVIEEGKALPLYLSHNIVGCVRQSHDTDENLSAHVILENLVCKASGLLSALYIAAGNTPADKVEYIIECSEEACGDINQRGGGNFAKSIGELAGFNSATGSDVRGFCAGPIHALLHAASLVDANVFSNVVVIAGGCVAKLGMNSKEHIKRGFPILEDMVGSFAVLISKDDGINPHIRTDVIGRHTIGTGSAPQQVIKALVADPLSKIDLKITDIDKYAGELQNPEITESAGAGNVPQSNYKMIGAMAVVNGEIARNEIPAFMSSHGFPGFAPTQGHIPSGIPALGYVREKIMAGDYKRAMIIGKGSLFLGRMTNLFDGLSLIIETPELSSNANETVKKIKIAITVPGSEHGDNTVINGALEAIKKDSSIEVYAIGTDPVPGLKHVFAENAEDAHKKMDALLNQGTVDGAVTMHYSFPIGTSTVGLVYSPASGKPMFVACTTGTTATDRVQSMVYNTFCGISAAKTYGIANPKVGILNVDGAVQVQRILTNLKEKGCDIDFADSVREGGGVNMRGNDLICCTPDVMVCDSLTGNLIMKLFSSFTSGGVYETSGAGYGPGIGMDGSKIIHIISRASGSPVIANAILYAASMVKGDLNNTIKQVFSSADNAGLAEVYPRAKVTESASVVEKKPVDEEITGIDVFELENAQSVLTSHGIYSETGMGCVGPVILVSQSDFDKATTLLKEAKMLS